MPPSWLHSTVVSIAKPNQPSHLPSSYRPISPTSNVCKLFEKMVVCHLNGFLEYHNILNISQSGFLQRHKTTDHILRLHDAIHKSLAGKCSLLTGYRSLVRSVIEYGMGAYFFASPSLLKPLHKIQNDALRLRTGAVASTPVLCPHHACDEMPLHIKHKFLCLKFKAHL